jgi:hypothetical protein
MAQATAAVIQHPSEGLAIAPDIALDSALNKLRFLAASCRASARVDLFRACAVLSDDRHAAAQAGAVAVLRTLAQALETNPVILAPGSSARSFDETWLLRLIDRSQAQDNPSLAFLIMRRVPMAKRHAFLHLINGLAKNIDAL